MNRDPQLLMSIQIALMGIVLIVGFFFIWRTLSRLETRIDELSCQVVNNACLTNNPGLAMSFSERPSIYKNATCPVTRNGGGGGDEDEEEDFEEEDGDEGEEEYDEEDYSIMKACFNDIDIPIKSLMDDQGATFMIFNTAVMKEDDNEGVLLEEIHEHDHKTAGKHSGVKKIEKQGEKQKDDASSVAETDANELSKNKLKKMNVDALRELCVARGLSTDGVKAALIDRILASIPSA